MQIRSKPMGSYATNCYIVTIDNKDLIIDPGVGAVSWVLENVTNPVAILNTHGHFDHIWSDAKLKEILNIPVIIHKDDAFFLQIDQFGMEVPKCQADQEVIEQELTIDGVKVRFLHFAGHTPGSCVIEIGEVWFSGDFIFKGSIGRVDFPFSDPEAMKKSLKRFQAIKEDRVIYPGHGEPTSIAAEQRFIPYWLRAI